MADKNYESGNSDRKYERLSVRDVSKKYNMSRSEAESYITDTRKMFIDVLKTHTYEQAAEILGTSVGSLRYAAKKMNFSKKAYNEYMAGAKPRIEEVRKERAYEQWINEAPKTEKTLESRTESDNVQFPVQAIEDDIDYLEPSEFNKPSMFRKAGRALIKTLTGIAAAGVAAYIGGSLLYSQIKDKIDPYQNPSSSKISFVSSANADPQVLTSDQIKNYPIDSQALDELVHLTILEVKYDSLIAPKAEQKKSDVVQIAQAPKYEATKGVSPTNISTKKVESVEAQKIVAPTNIVSNKTEVSEVVSTNRISTKTEAQKIESKTQSSNLDKRLADLDASAEELGIYERAGVSFNGENSIYGDIGYKTKNWGAALFAEKGEYGAEIGFFDLTKYKLDTTLAAYGGDGKGASLSFGKDFLFGKNDSWNIRPGIGAAYLKAADKSISELTANLMLQKQVGNWVFSIGLNGNSDKQVTGKNIGGLFSISYGGGLGNVMDHISGLGGLEERVREETPVVVPVVHPVQQPSGGNNENSTPTPAPKPTPTPPNPPAPTESDGTGTNTGNNSGSSQNNNSGESDGTGTNVGK